MDLEPPRRHLRRVDLVQIAEVELDPLHPRAAQPRFAQRGVCKSGLADPRARQVAFRQIALLDHGLEPVGPAGEHGRHRARLDAVAVETARIPKVLERHRPLVRSKLHVWTVNPKAYQRQPEAIWVRSDLC